MLPRLPFQKRSRALTLPLDEPQRVGIRRTRQQTLDQHDCSLFKLPFELREMIWRALLGGHCFAMDLHGVRVGDRRDPFPAWEMPGRAGEMRRGLKPWAWKVSKLGHFIAILLSCRRIYSETINLLYTSNLFYFRNPLTIWSFNHFTSRLLPSRLAQIRVLVLDETIGDPQLTFHASKKQWKLFCQTINLMENLRCLYLNVDSLYPKAWSAEREERLLSAVKDLGNGYDQGDRANAEKGDGWSKVSELQIVVRWTTPMEYKHGKRMHDYPVIRVEDFELPESLSQEHPATDMRAWIIEKVEMLGRAEV